MGSFFKIVFATIVGLILFIVLLVVFLIAIISSASSDKDEVSLENSVLTLTLDKEITERRNDNFFEAIGSPFEDNAGTVGLLEVRQSLEKAAKDPQVKGLYLELRDFRAGLGMVEELRNALIDFKTSGKFIVAYGEMYTEGGYYLASVADKIYLPPSGMLEFNGLDAELMFFKGTLEKLDLKPEVFKVGTYKSAVEPFIRDNMSDENRAQLTELLNSVHSHFVTNIAKARNLTESNLKNIADSMLIRRADDALRFKMITNMEYFDKAEEWMKTETKAEEKVNFVTVNKYLNKKKLEEVKLDENDNKIAVIFADGDIVDGKGAESMIASQTFSEEFRKARKNEKIKGIVLRVNSPGGSALASDIIWREVELCEKPVIVSMSDYAASGGYYISMPADTIVAQPTTITGSIGVFGLLFNGQGFLNNKLGITIDRAKTGKFSDIGSFTREISDYERIVIQQEVEHIYDDFITKAAKGRNTSKEKINEVGQGRVWAGTDAKKNGLVDVLGGMDDAVKIAAASAKLDEDYEVVYLPERKELFFKELLIQFMGDEESALRSELKEVFPYYQSMKEVMLMEGVQARIPYKIQIK